MTTIPCAIDDRARPKVMVMRFGEVETALEQARFDSAADTAHCSDGTVIKNYYKDHLGVRYFSPMDKSGIKKIPYGWCSWYYYGRDIVPEEVLVNARWFAENMKEYGADLILLDDGWQDNGRDWDGLRESFPQGMKWLADQIKALGLIPGIWLCPQGQDNMELIDREKCFMRHEDGASVCATFCGPYTVDPTKPEMSGYLQRLTERIVDTWGYEYLKLDGQPSLVKAYEKYHQFLQDPSIAPTDAYRMTLEAIRKGAGKETFISGCAGMPVETIGFFDAQRTGADCDAEWENGFLNTVTATMNGHFLHNVAWFSDPDCCMLRPPLSLDMARAWVTLMGITGQMLLFSDRMPDLGSERV
ncbi:MAG: alpha-galactosidase, partial [Planctomycetes bacterium]|nr:alpha-galactosidase [Planctomycetota bacterium]